MDSANDIHCQLVIGANVPMDCAAGMKQASQFKPGYMQNETSTVAAVGEGRKSHLCEGDGSLLLCCIWLICILCTLIVQNHA